ncbi:CubicO group peptidase, beta-lactamase class C family [Maribacter dokdonensis]|uniref:CubicO group peptidase, beta-lactamase class C family n=1 Tax=Maribacter dokdonensis TaxID=320912 RepID=A0ABY0UVH3_9FLAO|nr:serine hydrolase domain-containing protein [Maribacter dokdonensis]SDT24211.1 CubicO group peptidase, beta-lactamase class C family [Maribacter dokdonensis]
MKIKILFMIAFLTYGLNYGQKTAHVKAKIDSLFNAKLQDDLVHNAFLSVYSEKLEIDWNYFGGTFMNGEKVTKNNPFHSTSVAKTFTATLIMLLQEDGKLNINDPIAEYLPGEIIKGLHVFNGIDYSKKVLIKQLLQHTSGLPDYFADTPKNGATFMEQLFTNNDRFWQPLEIIEFTKTQLRPHFAPGASYNYCDTEYVLLGLLIEELTGKPYHIFLSDKIFNPLKMEHSYMHLRSRPISESPKKLSEFYVEQTNISTFKSLSADWAGGGIATTSNDLLKFYRALNNAEIISKKSFKSMQNWIGESYGLEYGYGLRKFDVKKLYPFSKNHTLIGHSGTSGSFMYYCPELDVYLTGTFNQTTYQKKHVDFMVTILSHLKNLTNVKSKRNG